jgi:biopolymer transport protein ExbD
MSRGQRWEIQSQNSQHILKGLSAEELRRLWEGGFLSGQDRVRREGSASWELLGRLMRSSPGTARRVEGSQPPSSPEHAQPRRGGITEDLDVDLELTPMIDVVFQLLIFFMLSGYFSAQPRVDLPLAQAGTGIAVQERVVLDLVAQPGSPLGAEVFPSGAAEPIPVAKLPDAVRALLQKARQPEVLLRASQDVPVRAVRAVLRAVEKAGVERVVVAVQGERR